MKKNIIFAAVLVLSIISTGVIVNALSERQFIAKESDFTVNINGFNTKFELPIVTINDNTYVPVRELCNKTEHNVEWDAENKTIYILNNKYVKMEDDMENSKNGTLTNGRKYKFYGTKEKDFSIDDYIDNQNLRFNYTYSFTIKEKTIEKIAERVQELACGDRPELEDLNIYYDKNKGSLLFESVSTEFSAGTLDFPSAITLNCDSGEMAYYGYNHFK